MEWQLPYLTPATGTEWAALVVLAFLGTVALAAVLLAIIETLRWLGLVPRDHGRPRMYGDWDE